MSVKEMKETLIKRIQESEDEAYLETLLEQKAAAKNSSDAVIPLSEGMKASIRKGREQIARGEYFTHEEVMREWKEWTNSDSEEWSDK